MNPVLKLVEPALLQVQGLNSLPLDWDGHDACPIGCGEIALATQVLFSSARKNIIDQNFWVAPDIEATPEGGVYMHWDAYNYWLCIDISFRRDRICILEKKPGETRGKTLLFDIAAFDEALEKFLYRRERMENFLMQQAFPN